MSADAPHPDQHPSTAERRLPRPHQMRAAALVGVVGLFLLSVVLTPFGRAPWWSPLLMLVALAGVVAWLRRSATQSAAADQVVRERPAAPRRRPQTVPVPVERADEQVYDVAPPAAPAPVAAEQVAPAVDPDAWQPVQVPPPTYTLKAKAERVEPAPAPTVDDAVYDARADLDETVAGQEQVTAAASAQAQIPVADLPFDGLALDEELEDLPPVHRAG